MKSEAICVEATGNQIEVQVEGKLTQAAYQQFVPAVEEIIQREGKVRMLFVMHNFHGWTAGALWDDIKFDIKHFSDIERLALVGETRWEKGMSLFCKPFTKAEVRYFDSKDIDQARAWLQETSGT